MLEYMPLAHKIAKRYSLMPDFYEEAKSAAYVGLCIGWEKRGSLEGKDLVNFLYTIMSREIRAAIAANRTVTVPESTWRKNGTTFEFCQVDEADELLGKQDDTVSCEDVLKTWGCPKHEQVIMLMRVDGWTVAEIAKAVGVSAPAVYKYIESVRKRYLSACEADGVTMPKLVSCKLVSCKSVRDKTSYKGDRGYGQNGVRPVSSGHNTGRRQGLAVQSKTGRHSVLLGRRFESRNPVCDIPWIPLTKTNQTRVSTGLWSRYGNPIIAPDWFLDMLPPVILDGELIHVSGSRQKLLSVVKKFVPGPGWEQICCHVFDSPPARPQLSFAQKMMDWNGGQGMDATNQTMPLARRLEFLAERVPETDIVTILPHTPIRDLAAAGAVLQAVCSNGGEGIVLKNPYGLYEYKRSNNWLKMKGVSDGEGIVVGFTGGLGRHYGALGALIVREIGHGENTFKLSGMIDEHRVLGNGNIASKYPDMPITETVESYYKIGQVVSFVFRGRTDAGVPQEARIKE